MMHRSAVRLGVIQVMVSVVLLRTIDSSMQVHTILRFVGIGFERQG